MLIKKWIDYMQNQEKSNETIKAYTDDINMLLVYLKKSDTIEDIKKIILEDLENFIAYLKNKKNNSASSRIRRIDSIKSFYKFLNKKNYITIAENITLSIDKPKVAKREMGFLTEQDAQNLLNMIDNARDKAIVMLFLNTGLRLSELLSIKVNDIKGNSLTVIGKGNKQRTVILNDNTIQCINKYLIQRPNVKHNTLFISNKLNKLSRSGVQTMIKNNLEKIGKGELSTHKLRHTAATMLIKNNVDIKTVQEILGHSNMATTSIYLHVDTEQKEKAANSIKLMA